MGMSIRERVDQNDVRHEYLARASERTGRPISQISPRQKHFVGRVAQNALKVGAPVREFVEAQFHMLDDDTCRRLWNLAYPPLFVMVTEGARWRWRAWSGVSATHNEVSLAKLIKTGDSRASEMKPEEIVLSVYNGYLPMVWAAHQVWRGRLLELKDDEAISQLIDEIDWKKIDEALSS